MAQAVFASLMETFVDKDITKVLREVSSHLMVFLKPPPPPPPPFSPAVAQWPRYMNMQDNHALSVAQELTNQVLSPAAGNDDNANNIWRQLTNGTNLVGLYEDDELNGTKCALCIRLPVQHTGEEAIIGVEALNVSDLGTLTLINLTATSRFSLALTVNLERIRFNASIAFRLDRSSIRSTPLLLMRALLAMEVTNVSLRLDANVGILYANVTTEDKNNVKLGKDDCFYTKRLEELNVTVASLRLGGTNLRVASRDVVGQDIDISHALNSTLQLVAQEYLDQVPALLPGMVGQLAPDAINRLLWKLLDTKLGKHHKHPIHPCAPSSKGQPELGALVAFATGACILAAVLAGITFRARRLRGGTSAASCDESATDLLCAAGRKHHGSLASHPAVAASLSYGLTISCCATLAAWGVCMYHVSLMAFNFDIMSQDAPANPEMFLPTAFMSALSAIVAAWDLRAYDLFVFGVLCWVITPMFVVTALILAWHCPTRWLSPASRRRMLQAATGVVSWPMMLTSLVAALPGMVRGDIGGERNYTLFGFVPLIGTVVWTMYVQLTPSFVCCLVPARHPPCHCHLLIMFAPQRVSPGSRVFGNHAADSQTKPHCRKILGKVVRSRT